MAAAQGKVIVTCAVTGSIHTPSMSPHLPVTPEETADGRPTQDPKMFMRFLPRIKQSCDVVINLTTGGAPTMSVEERLQPALQLKPEVASLNMGSMNFGLYEMIPRVKEFKHAWELPYLEASIDRIFKNTFKDIAYILESCSDNDKQ